MASGRAMPTHDTGGNQPASASGTSLSGSEAVMRSLVNRTWCGRAWNRGDTFAITLSHTRFMAAALTRGAKGTVRPAGVKNYGADESAGSALDFSGRPPTPERLARFRMPQEPGTRVRPGGPMREDAIDTERFYGTVCGKGKTAGEALDRSKTKLEEYAEVSAGYHRTTPVGWPKPRFRPTNA